MKACSICCLTSSASRRWTSTTSPSPKLPESNISITSIKSKRLDIDVSADFIYLAATLIHIKNRKCFLPVDPLLAGEEQQDPRNELVHRLLEHRKNSRTPLSFCIRNSRWKITSGRNRINRFYGGDEVQGELVVSLVDLVKTFQQVLERRKEVPKF